MNRPADSRRLLGQALLVLLGAAMLAVPVVDVLQDIAAGKTTTSTLVENTLPTLLALSLLATAAWLDQTDWEEDDVLRVAVWSFLGAGGTLVLMVWVLGIQWYFQQDFKPLVIAGNAVVAAAVAGTLVGIYRSDSFRRQRRLEAERNRFSALMENTTESIAEVAYEGGDLRIRAVNEAFTEQFGHDRAAVVGEPLTDLDYPDDTPGETNAEDILTRADVDEPFEAHVRRGTPDGVREFRVRSVPISETDAPSAYVTYTDITDELRLEYERRARSQLSELHTVASRMAAAAEQEELYDLAIDAGIDVAAYDAACLSIDGEIVRERETAGPVLPGDASAVVPGGDPVVVEDATVDGEEWALVVTVPVGDRGKLQLARRDARPLDHGDGEFEQLLATHLLEALRRLEREQQIDHERERLEFMNRIVRHNLLNGLNVVSARLELLGGHVDDAVDEHYETIVDRVDDMAELVETMRSFTQVITAGADHELEPVALDRTLETELEQARAAYPGAVFETEGSLPGVEVRADDLLGELFENLLTNAVQHNDRETPRVTVGTTVENDTVSVSVADNGPGIPPAEREEIFEKGSKGFESPGTGFGLYLVDELVEAYGGDLEVRNADPTGAVFTVTLQRADAAVATDAEPDYTTSDSS